jgi:hypothetical protein
MFTAVTEIDYPYHILLQISANSLKEVHMTCYKYTCTKQYIFAAQNSAWKGKEKIPYL